MQGHDVERAGASRCPYAVGSLYYRVGVAKKRKKVDNPFSKK